MVDASNSTMENSRRSAGRFWRILIYICIFVAVAAAGGGLWFYWRVRAALPQLDGTIHVPGLSGTVEVLRDARGVPHITAGSIADLAFAQGYVTAQDRLWQMDLTRRIAWGELSEILGRRTLAIDIENRKLGFHEVADRAVGEMDPASRAFLDAYSRGVNAFVSTHRGRLPIEFVILHYQPRPWTPADCLAVALNMEKTLNSSWRTDLMREDILRHVGPKLYADMVPDSSALDRPVAEPVKGPVRTVQPDAEGRLARLLRPPKLSGLDPVLAALLAPLDTSRLALGSNDWVVSGAHTYSGKPLLSNDPHLRHGEPSVWYEIHIKAPGINAIGVSLPGTPTVIIGHNARIAWGMTNTGPDVQDLFIERFNPKNPDEYLHDGRWQKAEVRDEVIHVRGQKDVRLKVLVTRHGPVISNEGGRALALEWTALQPHALRVAAFLKLDEAQNWRQFTDALREFSGPEQNMVYADVDGNIGYYAPAWVPIRKKGDGSVPVPGDTDDYDWQGYIPFEDLPHAFNPPGGIIATANSRVVPDRYPYFITHDWVAPWRTARIFQLLEAGGKLTVADMLRIDMDVYSMEDMWLAKWLIKAGKARPPQDPAIQHALEIIGQWDGEARENSAATLILETARPILLQRLLRPKLGDAFSEYHWSLDLTFVDNVLRNNWARWLPPGDRDFNDTVMKSLEEAVGRIPQITVSPDPKDWKWGRTIPLLFRHPLDPLPFGRWLFDVGPFPQWGMATTVKATTPSSGPSMRMVVDFADLDRSVNNITLGESGEVTSRYYRDQFDAWYHGRSFPMLFSDQAVQQGTVHKLELIP
jgi:penicillin G amidase